MKNGQILFARTYAAASEIYCSAGARTGEIRYTWSLNNSDARLTLEVTANVTVHCPDQMTSQIPGPPGTGNSSTRAMEALRQARIFEVGPDNLPATPAAVEAFMQARAGRAVKDFEKEPQVHVHPVEVIPAAGRPG